MINAFGPEVIGENVEGKVMNMSVAEHSGRTYYQFELEPPHCLITATAAGNRLYLFNVTGNGEQPVPQQKSLPIFSSRNGKSPSAFNCISVFSWTNEFCRSSVEETLPWLEENSRLFSRCLASMHSACRARGTETIQSLVSTYCNSDVYMNLMTLKMHCTTEYSLGERKPSGNSKLGT